MLRFGARYAYNASARTFELSRGEPLFLDADGRRVEMEVDYPETVYISGDDDGGNHPEVFSAHGSHGTWASEG